MQTGPNESLNSVATLKYLGKAVSYRWIYIFDDEGQWSNLYQIFSWEMTWSRSVLGAVDINLSGGKNRCDGQERFKTQVLLMKFLGQLWLPIAAPANKKYFKNFCNFSWSVQLSTDCFDFIIWTVQKGRSSSKWVARPIYEAKNYSWKFDLMTKVTLQLSTLL